MQNSKHKIRNPDRFGRLSFRYFRICFGFRYSNFGFIVLVVCSLWFGISTHSAFASTINQPPVTLGLISGLVGHWTFDGQDMAGERAYDRSGQNNTGLLTNGPTKTIGKIGQALSFDGVNDYVNVPHISTLEIIGDLTLSVWLYHRGQISADSFVAKGAAYNTVSPYDFWVSNNGTLNFSQNDGSANQETFTSVLPVPLSIWTHVVVTRSGTNIKLFTNGVQGLSATYTRNPTASGDPLTIGDNLSGAPFDGLIDDVRIYNRALSASEIKRLYNIGAASKLNTTLKDALSSGLVGHWTFDGQDMAGERAYDRSGQNNTGLLTNGPTRAIGKIGQALSFDGADDYVDTADIDFAAGNFTLSAWFKTSVLKDQRILSKYSAVNNQIWLMVLNDGTLEAGVYDGTSWRVATDPSSRSNNMWHHVAMDVTTSNIIFYVNGAQVGSDVHDNSFPVNNSTWNIGRNNDGTEYFNGAIDDVRIYNRALSASEIKRLYNIGAASKLNTTLKDALSSGLVGHWTFDGQDMAGERAYDRSGQNNTGTLTNGPTRAIGKIGQALNFDGVNDDVSTNNTVDLPGEMSVFAWIKSNTVQTDAFGDYIVASNNEAQFTLAHDTYVGGGILEARWNNERISSCEVGTITVGKWYHVGFTRTGSSGNWTCRVYINGALAKTGTGIATNPGVAGIVRIGSRQSGTYFLFDGLIDDVRIYNRALSEQEVKQLYLMGK